MEENQEENQNQEEEIVSQQQYSDDESDDFEKVTTKQVGMKWGVIAGIVSILTFLALALTGMIYDSSASWLGMIPFIVILVLAHKEFKDGGDGFMSYGQGLGLGVFVAAVSAVISSLFSYVYIKFIDTEYYENMNAALLEQWEEQGMTQEQIDTALGFTSNMQNPELGIVFGILAGIFFGFIVSLLVSAFTKNSNPEMDL